MNTGKIFLQCEKMNRQKIDIDTLNLITLGRIKTSVPVNSTLGVVMSVAYFLSINLFVRS